MQEKSFERNTRLEGEIRSVMSELLRFEVNDPRLTDVTVSLIRLSADRTKAMVYFSVIGDEEREREAGDGFSAAAAFLRRQLGQKMRLRVVPSLEFLRDTSFEYGDRMERLFERLSENGMLPPADDDSTASKEDS